MTTTDSPTARRLTAAAAAGYRAHLHLLGPLPAVPAAQLIAMTAAAGLTGRGGAAFPVGRKLAAVQAGGRGVVVANGAEGEPASSKDHALLAQAPHLVLDGLALASRAVGATSAYLYASGDLLRDGLARALAERRDDVPVRPVEAAATFVSGQSSAVVAAINGARPVPTMAPPSVHARGVGGRPTLVQNVETLAQLALLARYGPDWFRRLGTPDEPGTRLVTVSGAVRSPGVYEVAGGSPLASVLDLAGGMAMPVQALLVGGYHGGWVPWNAATASLPHSRAALAGYGADPGAGVVVALSSAQCGLRAGAEIAAYLAGQSAGQCGPCVHGLPAVAAHLARLAARRSTPSAVRELLRVVGLVEGRGACHHPDGTGRLVRSTLATFAAEVELHLAGRCSATGPTVRGGQG
jgi:NADH:ubiquinone oxidoreductase subunit F (NADH-binding)